MGRWSSPPLITTGRRTRARRGNELADGGGHGGLAVGGRPIHEYRFSEREGRADRIEQLVPKNQMGEVGTQAFGRHADAGDRLTIGLFDIVFQRHGSGADVAAQLHGVLSASPSQIRQIETVAHPADDVAAGYFEAFLILWELERVF